ncbi:citramalate synthase [Aestuariimicrobium ganziense]|uniref:citramalate synthase n=1 Tax=Aestuariimicrobium ganziense TaxID=2773677 RepID=UPI0019406705|nr:citramalate synthase [Aestuariimicrobium ganziense]
MTVNPVAPEHFHVYDTTLRDGAQQEGIRLSVHDKMRIATLLDELGVTHIEGGWPGANPNDTEFFRQAAEKLTLRNAKLVAFGATRRAGAKAADDPQVAALRDAGTEIICLVAKSHDRHVEQALRTTLDENLAMVTDTVSHLVAEGKRVFVDCEHFFDGFRRNSAYSLEVVRAAAEAGADVAVLCDTNGGMLPSWMGDIVSAASQIGLDLGIHCHNDTGCAVANSLAAIEAGAMHVQGTVNGYGERTGNADLTTVVANLQLKYGWDLLGGQGLESLTHISHGIAEITNQPPQVRQPYVGHSSFAHKAGLHASAIRVDPNLYQHIEPELVGNGMRMLISDMSGRANIQIKAEQIGVDLTDRDQAAKVADRIKQREMDGYSYEACDASFELLLSDELGQLDKPFEVDAWAVTTRQKGSGPEISDATIGLTIGGEPGEWSGSGNGPVNALDAALRDALVPRFGHVDGWRLTDYRVRILDDGQGTDAKVRVLIDTDNGEQTWTTVGVGFNVIEASWEALSDAYLYGLFKQFA